MLKIVVTLSLLLFVHCKDEESDTSADDASVKEDKTDVVVLPEDKLAKVVMPAVFDKALQNVNANKCLDKKLYEDENTLSGISSEADYLCAFIAFQANKDASTQYYSKYADKLEATWRFENFKKCVEFVNGINAKDLSWRAEVNYFCDMTEEEKASRRGLVFPDEAGSGRGKSKSLGGPPGSSDDAPVFGVGLAAPESRGSGRGKSKSRGAILPSEDNDTPPDGDIDTPPADAPADGPPDSSSDDAPPDGAPDDFFLVIPDQ